MFKTAANIILLISPMLAVATSSIEDAKNMVKGHQDQIQQNFAEMYANDFNSLKSSYDQFTPHPDEEKHYQSSRLKDDGKKVAKDSTLIDQLKLAKENSDKTKNQEMAWFLSAAQQAKVIVKNINDHMGGINQDAIDCTKERHCETNEVIKQCQHSANVNIHYCVKKLKVTTVPKQTEIPVIVHVAVKMHDKKHDYAGLKANLRDGSIIWKQPREGSFSISGAIPPNIACDHIVGSWQITRANSLNATIDSIRYPTCSDPTIDIHFRSNHRLEVEADIHLRIVAVSKDYKDEWDLGCDDLEHSLHCKFLKEVCSAENMTRVIDGVSIFRSCWEKEVTFQCDQTINNNVCLPLVNAGCTLKNSRCMDQRHEQSCLTFLDDYLCKITTCVDTKAICQPEKYCDDPATCGAEARKPDPDFGNAVSQLSATFEAGKKFNQAPIFAGEPKTCNKYALNSVNCCADSGWLHDTSQLFQCGPEAVALGQARERGLAVYVGYDKREEPLKKIRVFCVFPSKLAQIIQEQGRYQQLGISFGNVKRPDCRGLTPDELQRIDFVQIDFHNFILDLNKNINREDEGLVNKRIQDHMKKMQQEGRAYDDS